MPLVINFSVFLYVESIVSDEILTTNNYMMKQIQQDADEIIRSVRKINIDIMSDFHIKEVINYGVSLSDEQYYYIQKAKNLISKYRSADTSLSDIFLYLRAADIVITPSNVMSSHEYYNIYLKQYTSYEEWCDILSASYPITSYMPVTMNNNVNVRTDNVMCLCSFGADNIETAVIASFIDQSTILNSFNPIREMSRGYVNLINTNNNLLLNVDETNVLSGLKI